MTESRQEPTRFTLQLGELRYPLPPGQEFTIGSDPACQLRLSHGSISPTHCRLRVTEDGITVEDLHSTGGTRLDDARVTESAWQPGQVLALGSIRIELVEESHEPVPMTAAEAAAAFGLGPIQAPESQRSEPDFGQIMASELRRAPWLALSILLHAGIGLLLWVLSETPIPLGSEARTFRIEPAEAEEDLAEETFEEEQIEEETRIEDSEFVETEAEEAAEEEVIVESEVADQDSGFGNSRALMTRIGGSGMDDILKAGKGSLSGSFRKTVAGLRKNGLEIVFVFDSTGSMGTVLQAAKDRMERMVSVMLELVPYAKIGVITYRDRGESEEYLTRQVSLSRDFYRSINFLSRIFAGGGGDQPEAVYDALKVAINQRWGKSSRRMVILIGDAPPHERNAGKINNMVRKFVGSGRSHVHAIITRPSGGGDVATETRRSFKRIAKSGRGEALEFEDEGKILRMVMRLAFGKSESRSLDEVYKLVDKRARHASSRSRRIVERGDIARIRQEFSRSVVNHDLIKAILQKPTAKVLNTMVDIASIRTFNQAGRHAAAYILNRALRLDNLPVDPESSRGLSARRAQVLKAYIARKIK